MGLLRNLDMVYLYFLTKIENPRITINAFHEIQNTYHSDNSVYYLLKEAFEKQIISNPEIFCNTGVSIDLQKTDENQLKLLRACKKDPKSTYAIALCGDWSFLRVRKGASELRFADRVIPTYPAEVCPHEIFFNQKGILPEDTYPHGWDEIDWEVYDILKDPSISYTDATRKSHKEGTGLCRSTIKKHFKKILKDCKIQMNFFPRGYKGYDRVLFTFKTEYEIGLYNSLKKLDRTSFLWKVNDFIVLILFVEQYNATVRRFKEIEEDGLIQNLKVSIPNRHYTPFEEDFD